MEDLTLDRILIAAAAQGASDLFIQANSHINVKAEGEYRKLSKSILTAEEAEGYIHDLYQMAQRDVSHMEATSDDDFSFDIPEVARFRVNVYRNLGSLGAVIRLMHLKLPTAEALHIPEEVLDVSDATSGLVLVTGTAGSGKSSTVACIIKEITRKRSCHVIVLEDPVEFLYTELNGLSIVTQREIGSDTESYETALRAALRQVPDVLYMGELRDSETMRVALSAAESGHLVLATMHTRSAAESIDRIIDNYPAEQRPQIRSQLANVVNTVISQKLVRGTNGKRHPLFEVMVANIAIRNLIRQNQTHLIPNSISTGEGMFTMDDYIVRLVKEGIISREIGLTSAFNPSTIEPRMPPASSRVQTTRFGPRHR